MAVNMFISAANKSLLEPLVDTRGNAVSASSLGSAVNIQSAHRTEMTAHQVFPVIPPSAKQLDACRDIHDPERIFV